MSCYCFKPGTQLRALMRGCEKLILHNPLLSTTARLAAQMAAFSTQSLETPIITPPVISTIRRLVITGVVKDVKVLMRIILERDAAASRRAGRGERPDRFGRALHAEVHEALSYKIRIFWVHSALVIQKFFLAFR